MKKIKLNGRPVEVGTHLQYIETEKHDPEELLPDFVIVNKIDATHVHYVGEGVDGEIRIDRLHETFKHYEIEYSPEYELEHITDLMSIPDDRLDDCLDEMKLMIRAMRATITAAVVVQEEQMGRMMTESEQKEFTRAGLPSIRWCDDRKEYAKINNAGITILEVQTK